jgi:hypothetical protein
MRIEGQNPGMSFYVTGSDDEDSLLVEAELRSGHVALQLPVAALPWRDLRLLERNGGRRVRYGCGDERDPAAGLEVTLEGPEVAMRTDVQGAQLATLANGIATLHAEGTSLLVPCLRVAEQVRMPVAVRIFGARTKRPRGAIHVAQLSGGRRVGGVTIQFGAGAPRDERLGRQAVA